MKTKTFLLALSLLALFSCNSNKKKSKEIASYSYSAEVKLNSALYKSAGAWIEEGLECYGIIVMYDDNGDVVSAKPIKAKTIVITEKAIKMKALETVSLAPKKGCSKLGLEKGDTWWEKTDLFRTKEEANAFIANLPSISDEKRDTHFTVD